MKKRAARFHRPLRTRVYVLAVATRGLMLLHLVAVLTIVGMYATALRGYPRTTAGWLMVPTALTMASTTAGNGAIQGVAGGLGRLRAHVEWPASNGQPGLDQCDSLDHQDLDRP
jgi:hypothetical protein